MNRALLIAAASLATFAVTGSTQSLAAQTGAGYDAGPAVRSGFHFSIGAGGGAAGITCEGCEFNADNALNGFSGVVRIGGAVSPHVVLGLEGMGWIRNDAPVERRIASASVTLLLYPSASAGFFLKGGVGYMRAVIENDAAWIASDGIAPQVGIGFDIPLGGGLALTPYVNGLISTNTSSEVLGYNLPMAFNPVVVQAGFALTTP